ncbi:hypothetical protein J2Y66_002892 [Paenarthrobacter nitroguajacolicus]|nr:hypothetical protein [Paenarthrobacter nitroguajacolicus]
MTNGLPGPASSAGSVAVAPAGRMRCSLGRPLPDAGPTEAIPKRSDHKRLRRNGASLRNMPRPRHTPQQTHETAPDTPTPPLQSRPTPAAEPIFQANKPERWSHRGHLRGPADHKRLRRNGASLRNKPHPRHTPQQTHETAPTAAPLGSVCGSGRPREHRIRSAGAYATEPAERGGPEGPTEPRAWRPRRANRAQSVAAPTGQPSPERGGPDGPTHQSN